MHLLRLVWGSQNKHMGREQVAPVIQSLRLLILKKSGSVCPAKSFPQLQAAPGGVCCEQLEPSARECCVWRGERGSRDMMRGLRTPHNPSCQQGRCLCSLLVPCSANRHFLHPPPLPKPTLDLPSLFLCPLAPLLAS